MIRYLLIIPLCLILVGCQEDSRHRAKGWKTDEINGRNRIPTYEVEVPESWKKLESTGDNLQDTKTPLVTFLFTEGNQTFTVTVHNFPLHDIDEQVPPLAQVDRWKRQFETLDPSESELKPVAFGGYTGQFFKGVGIFKGKKMAMLAWSLQLPTEHYRALNHPESALERFKFDQMRSDVTIKVLGPDKLVTLHREDIDKFVNSFHMIEAIPAQ